MASDKNEMIGRLLKFYKVENTKIKYKNMTDYAHFDVDSGVLELSTKYKDFSLKATLKRCLVPYLVDI